jgi:hypothetical protein
MPPNPAAPWTRADLLLALGIGAMVTAVRFVALGTVPGEWFGDISTLWEMGVASRNGDFAPTWYTLGVGPLYPLAIVAPLSLLGTPSYLTFKLASAVLSLAGLVLLYRLALRLCADRRLALLVVLLAGTSAWVLALSRLGDQHMLPFVLTVAAVLLAAGIVQQAPHPHWRAVGCGTLAAAGLYAYGATFLLPVLCGAIVLAGVVARRVPAPVAWLFAAAMLVCAAPIVINTGLHWAEVQHGHFAKAAATPADIPHNIMRGLRAFAAQGDRNPRLNPPGQAYLDALSVAALLAGTAWWLQRRRRTAGALVIGAFLLMQLPSFLAGALQVPNAGRIVGAAPFTFLLVAGGLWWALGALQRRMPARMATASIAIAVAAIVAINLHRYFVAYPASLPFGNIQVAQPIEHYIATLAPGVHVYLVDTGWAPNGIPEIKSVRYQAPIERAIDELVARDTDCASVAALARPGVLVWRPQLDAPFPLRCGCLGELTVQLHADVDGVPLFRSAPLPPRDSASPRC